MSAPPSTVKRCICCEVEKPLVDFYARVNKCRECTKAAVRANYRRNRDHYVRYDRFREHTTDRKSWKEEAQKRHRALNPEKYRARTAVSNAIRDKRLTREQCEACGASRSHGHHDDYSRPLDVRWLCKDCHWQEHGGVTKGKQISH